MDRRPSGGAAHKASESRKRKEAPSAGPPAASRRGQGGAPPGGGGRAQKRARFREARVIQTQSADAALRDGQLDLPAFLAAREFEIHALEASMRRTRAASAARAFQKLPRGLRRRTASHNAKRVPRRLRARARREQTEDHAPTVEARRRRPRTTRARIRAETAKRLRILAEKKRRRKEKQRRAAAGEERGSGATEAAPGGGGGAAAAAAAAAAAGRGSLVQTRPPRPKIRRNRLNDPPRPRSRFRKRQIDKTWLPTHLWHAKRARMTDPRQPLWRFALPRTPTEKCYRPTHRASGDRGAVIWDVSYMSTIGLYGHAGGVERVLRALGVAEAGLWSAAAARGRRWRAGARAWSGMLSRETKGGGGGRARRDIGPATVIWNPESAAPAAPAPAAAPAAPAPPPAEHGAPPWSSSGHKKAPRQVFLRVHPSCFLELFDELLRLVKTQTPHLYVEDLRYEIGSIELTGPASTEALLATLCPYDHGADDLASRDPHAAVFRALAGLTNPASLPADALLAFSVLDPRLRYPPRRVPPPTTGARDDGSSGASFALLRTLASWPVGEANSKPSGLFDRDARFRASRMLPSHKAISRRRSRAARPGEPLDATADDPPIPVVLLASRPSSPWYSQSPSPSQQQGTWTLLAPWQCVQPLWYSLVHVPLSTGGNPRFGGLDELRQVAFERGVPWFPGDFPATDAGARWELEERARRRAAWERRPRGKRVAWTSLDLGAGRRGEVGDGLSCDWERLFGLSPTGESAGPRGGARVAASRDFVPMEIDEAATASATPSGDRDADPEEARKALGTMCRLSRAEFAALLDASSLPPPPPPGALVTVRLAFVAKGVATACARIYRLPPSRSQAVAAVPSTLAEVPSTQVAAPRSLPPDLRDQWLSRLPRPPPPRGDARAAAHKRSAQQAPPPPLPPPPRRIPPGTDMETRKRLIAASLVGGGGAPLLPCPGSGRRRSNQEDMGGHPLCPDEADLIGFVTSGAFSLSEGRGTAVGSLSAQKAAEAVRRAGSEAEGRLCVVRNAGESVGWLARWTLV